MEPTAEMGINSLPPLHAIHHVDVSVCESETLVNKRTAALTLLEVPWCGLSKNSILPFVPSDRKTGLTRHHPGRCETSDGNSPLN